MTHKDDLWDDPSLIPGTDAYKIEQEAKLFLDIGYEPVDAEPGEWLRMEHPDGRWAEITPDDTEQGGESEPPPEAVVLRDAIGSGIGVHLFRNRGIVSVVLVDDANGIPLPNTPSAEVEMDSLIEAVEKLA